MVGITAPYMGSSLYWSDLSTDPNDLSPGGIGVLDKHEIASPQLEQVG